MLRKVYLTTTLPETASVQAKSLPDVNQQMNTYKREKDAYKADAPLLRPNPLEKYDRRGGLEENTIGAEDRDEAIRAEEGEEVAPAADDTLFFEERYGATISTLPKHVQSRAWRLLPYLIDKDMGDLNMRDVLYDLSVPGVKKIHSTSIPILRSLYRQLDADLTLPKSYYVKKQLPREDGGRGEARQTHRQSILASPPGRKNPPSLASAPRGTPATPLFQSKASTVGGRAFGDEMGIFSTPAAGMDPPRLTTPLWGVQEDASSTTTTTVEADTDGERYSASRGRGKGRRKRRSEKLEPGWL